MWVPVAVWQPCELLYTCYLLTYLLAYRNVAEFAESAGECGRQSVVGWSVPRIASSTAGVRLQAGGVGSSCSNSRSINQRRGHERARASHRARGGKEAGLARIASDLYGDDDHDRWVVKWCVCTQLSCSRCLGRPTTVCLSGSALRLVSRRPPRLLVSGRGTCLETRRLGRGNCCLNNPPPRKGRLG